MNFMKADIFKNLKSRGKLFTREKQKTKQNKTKKKKKKTSSLRVCPAKIHKEFSPCPWDRPFCP
jgi:hypothetical protein